jgi:hypothetical protein
VAHLQLAQRRAALLAHAHRRVLEARARRRCPARAKRAQRTPITTAVRCPTLPSSACTADAQLHTPCTIKDPF